MSVFFVGNESINKVANTTHRYYGNVITNKYPTAQEWAQALYDLNVQALVGRYGTQMVEEVPDFEYKEVELGVDTAAEVAQLYGSIACLMYQCSEADAPEADAYKTLVDAQNAVANGIAWEFARKNNAQWV